MVASCALVETACSSQMPSAAQAIANVAQSAGALAAENGLPTSTAAARGVEDISELSLQGLSNTGQPLDLIHCLRLLASESRAKQL